MGCSAGGLSLSVFASPPYQHRLLPFGGAPPLRTALQSYERKEPKKLRISPFEKRGKESEKRRAKGGVAERREARIAAVRAKPEPTGEDAQCIRIMRHNHHPLPSLPLRAFGAEGEGKIHENIHRSPGCAASSPVGSGCALTAATHTSPSLRDSANGGPSYSLHHPRRGWRDSLSTPF